MIGSVGDQWMSHVRELAEVVKEAQAKGIPPRVETCAWCMHPPTMTACSCKEDCGQFECLAGVDPTSHQPGETRALYPVPRFEA